MKPSEVLAKAADLIEPEGAWTQRYFARVRPDGNAIGPQQANARCWCALGALDRVAGAADTPTFLAAVDYLAALVPIGVSSWNDDPDRTQAEVVKALRDAAEHARSEGN